MNEILPNVAAMLFGFWVFFPVLAVQIRFLEACAGLGRACRGRVCQNAYVFRQDG